MLNPKPPYIIPIFISHLGCPFHCLYCQQERITGQQTWLPSSEEIQDRVERFLQTRKSGKYSHTEVAFYGGTFTGLSLETMETMLQAVLPFVERREVTSLRASTKPDFIFEEKLERMLCYQMNTVELGVQSLDDVVLRKVGRGYDSQEVERAVQKLRKFGMRVGIQLMQGLPGADEAEAMETARRAISLKPDFVRIYPTVVLKSTGLEQLYYQGRYRPWSLEKAVEVCRRLKSMFVSAGIPIIKMGLEFSTDEREGIVAGPYHPNFRQLVG